MMFIIIIVTIISVIVAIIFMVNIIIIVFTDKLCAIPWIPSVICCFMHLLNAAISVYDILGRFYSGWWRDAKYWNS